MEQAAGLPACAANFGGGKDMMNLDDYSSFAALDGQGMQAQIEGLPGQLEQAWQLGQTHDLPQWSGIRQVVVAGMGGSAIGGDLLAAYAESRARASITIHRDYDLPAWAAGPETLVIASSHSGNTEETVSAFEAAATRGCRCLAVARGGQLSDLAQQAQAPLWTFEHEGQPRAAVGFSFGLLLAAVSRLGLLPDPAEEVRSAVDAMRRQQESLGVETPAVNNMAKRVGGQLMGRILVAIGSGVLAPVARRWKGQVNELAKAWAQFDVLPEADHNTLAGMVYPPELLSQLMAIFLRASSDHPRNARRLEMTRRSFMLEGIGTDFFQALGDTALAHQWTALQFGDYMAFYLAMAYGIDPTPIPAIQTFKAEMTAQSGSVWR
jgi:glucose/mannose-6-phosphate isomerase